MRRFIAAGAAMALGAGLLASVSTPAVAQDDDDETQTLTVAANQEVDTFNPYKSRFVITYNANTMTYDTLTRAGEDDYEPQPGLATEWQESSDGLTWEFTIRDDVQWSDGEQLTAQDVAYTYGNFIEDDGIRDWNINFAANIAGVDAPDDTTFILELNEPAPADVLYEGVFIVPQHIWEDYDDPADDNINDEMPIVGSGPFQVSEYRTDEFLRLEANEDYWDGAPAFDEIVYDYYSEPDASVAALEAGTVDIVSGLNPAQADSLENEDHITVNNVQDRRWVSLVLNHGAQTADGEGYGDGHPALEDEEVRQALHQAIDKEELVDRVLDGHGDPGVSIVPEIFEDLHWDGGDDLFEFDLDAANQVLDDAGYEMGDNGVRTMPDSDEELEFRFFHHADNTDYANVVEFIGEWWEEIGIATEMEPYEQGTLNDLVYLGEYDIAFSGWGVGPNPTEILSQHTCEVLPTTTDGQERSHENFFCNDDYDELQDLQKTESDPDTRAEYIHEQQQILYENSSNIWLYYQNSIEAYNHDNVENMQVQPEDGMITGQQGFLYAFHTATPTEGSSDEGVSTGVMLAIGGAVILLLAGVAFYVVQRRKTADERE